MANSPPLVIGNCIQVKLNWLLAGNAGVNVLHFSKGGTTVIDQTRAESIGSAIKTAYTANLAVLQAPNVALASVSTRDLSAPNLPEFTDTGALVGGSDATGQPLPPQTAFCLTFRTAKSGKSFRGRIYLGGFTETNNDGTGAASAAVSTGCLGFLDDVMTAMGNLGHELQVASRPANASQLVRRTGLPNGDIVEEILSSTTQKAGGIERVEAVQARDLRWETQRRRGNGRGSALAALLSHPQQIVRRS